jgi:hypothetical protein
MNRKLHVLLLCVAVLLCAQTLFAQTATKATALDRYIAQKDPVYGWKLVNTIKGQDCTCLRVGADFADLAH